MILPTGIFQSNEQVLIKYFHIFSIYFCVLAIGERQISSVGEQTTSVGEQTYTLDEAVEHIGFGLYHVIVIVIAGLSWVSIIYLESVAKRYYIHKYFTITLFLRVLKKEAPNTLQYVLIIIHILVRNLWLFD